MVKLINECTPLIGKDNQKTNRTKYHLNVILYGVITREQYLEQFQSEMDDWTIIHTLLGPE